MKEVLGSLPEVITAYKNYNLLVPTATDVQLNPFYKFHVEEVPVDLGENSGDIFKVGSVKTGKQDEKGKDIWEDVFSLSKPLLNKMAMAAGIQFNPKETYGERIDRVTYRAQAQGAMRKADGTARTETDQKVICLEDEEEKYRIEFADKATKGITDEKQAQAAAEIFSGQWVESKNKWGKKCQAFVVAKEDRDRYIDRSVMVNMALLKKTWAEKAMTGAKLRVIRALLGVKGTYTKAELQKNFAIPTVIFSPDFSDPQVRQAMLTQGMISCGVIMLMIDTTTISVVCWAIPDLFDRIGCDVLIFFHGIEQVFTNWQTPTIFSTSDCKGIINNFLPTIHEVYQSAQRGCCMVRSIDMDMDTT